MPNAFIHRNPTADEVERIRLSISSFQDGSGQEKDADGTTRAGWRDLERVIAEILGGEGGENKDVFDVIVPSADDGNTAFGLSLKSTELRRSTAIQDLATTGRVYMELCNSPAKLWVPLKQKHGVTEAEFSGQRHAKKVGDSVLETVHTWHAETKARYDSLGKRKLDLSRSVYLVISYSPQRAGRPRRYQIHAFNLDYAKEIQWKYISDRCLRGFDPDHPDEVLFDWYGLSGGQLKYYPRATTAVHLSPPFELEQPRGVSIAEKCSRYWPKEWVAAKGTVPISHASLATEFRAYVDLFADQKTKETLNRVADELRSIKKD